MIDMVRKMHRKLGIKEDFSEEVILEVIFKGGREAS